MSSSRFMSIRALIAASLMGVCGGVWAQAQADAPVAHPQLDGMRVAIDPVTKQLRALNAAESKALDGAAASSGSLRAGASKPMPIASRLAGVRGMRLGADQMSYSRAVIGADGKLSMDCVEGAEGAQLPVAGPVQRVEAELE
jgi:hypothetical protein